MEELTPASCARGTKFVGLRRGRCERFAIRDARKVGGDASKSLSKREMSAL
jgi:hypothetical protein